MISDIAISVIVPVWNDSYRVLKCIDALKSQTLPKEKFEIIVVDNGSQDNTFEVLQQLEGITVLQECTPGSYAARNKAISVANGAILAFTDSDCLPEKTWLENLVSCINSDENIGIVAGEIKFFEAENDDVEREALAFESMFSMNQKKYAEKGLCITANWCSKKSVLEAHSGFRTDLKSGGDHDMSRRIVDSGLKVKYCEEAKVYHPARNKQELLKKRRRVIGGSWDKSNGKFKTFTLLKNSSKLFLKRLFKAISISNYSVYEKVLIIKMLFLILGVSISEVLKLTLGKESSRS
ncbi:glycosyltransferase family 2 protein [Alteromonas sp. KUL106]|uniref:glycosyltransferase n=1 Tax=Alteromonas sp. KUL106 TaxID=2480799 RepID=UPI0012E6A5F1|nr:glycosyltransferase [Alteromonas sp. KUL106]GFD68755.1 hypothetical protein KUL106_20180 [Alteromonas sp. KUL106]